MSVIGRVNGPMLKENLVRLGVDLAFETDLLYLDVNNARIGVNNAFPSADLEVSGVTYLTGNGTPGYTARVRGGATGDQLAISTHTTAAQGIGFDVLNAAASGYAPLKLSGSSIQMLADASSPTATLLITNAVANVTGNLFVSNTANIGNLEVPGSITFTGNSNISNLHVPSLTATRVVFAGTNGKLVDDVDLTFDGSNLYIQGGLSVVGFGAIDDIYLNGTTISANVTDYNLYLQTSGTGVVNTTNLKIQDLTANSLALSGTAGRIVTNPVMTYDPATPSINIANLNLAHNDISINNTNGNIYLTPNGTGIAVVNTSTAVKIPVGDAFARPAIGSQGMLRFSTTTNLLEFYNGTDWVSLSSSFSNFTSDEFFGDGSTAAFTLSQSASTNTAIVNINGVIQKPSTAYTVSGTTLTFTEAPQPGDTVEVRIVSSSASVDQIKEGTTQLAVSNSAPYVRNIIQGTIKTELNASNLILNDTNLVANITGQSVNASPVKIDEWSPSSYSGSKYLVQINNGTSRQLTELLVTANTTAAYIANVGSVNSGSALMTFTANISSGNVALWGTGTGSGNTVKVSKQLIV